MYCRMSRIVWPWLPSISELAARVNQDPEGGVIRLGYTRSFIEFQVACTVSLLVGVVIKSSLVQPTSSQGIATVTWSWSIQAAADTSVPGLVRSCTVTTTFAVGSPAFLR